MELRAYTSADAEETAHLFYETVHAVNRRDYTEGQLWAWAPGRMDPERWNASFRSRRTCAAVGQGRIIGFGDMDETGYLDRLYVHKDFQRMGVATAICDRLERAADTDCIRVHASITAHPFFEKRGYVTEREQTVEKGGERLTNYVMIKRRSL